MIIENLTISCPGESSYFVCDSLIGIGDIDAEYCEIGLDTPY